MCVFVCVCVCVCVCLVSVRFEKVGRARALQFLSQGKAKLLVQPAKVLTQEQFHTQCAAQSLRAQGQEVREADGGLSGVSLLIGAIQLHLDLRPRRHSSPGLFHSFRTGIRVRAAAPALPRGG